MQNIKHKIESLEIKSVALRKAADEYQQELEELKTKAAQPAPRIRRSLKTLRIAEFEKNFITDKWKKKKIA